MRKPKTYELRENKIYIREVLIEFGIHPSVFENLPADFYRLNKSQLRRLSEYACDSLLAEMFNITQKEVRKRRYDFGLQQDILSRTKFLRKSGISPEMMQTIEVILDACDIEIKK